MESKTYLHILARKWRIILASFLITFIATVVFTYTQPAAYQATGTYIVRVGATFQDDRGFVSALDTLSRRVEIASTYAEVTSSRMIRNLAADALGLSLEQREQLSVDSRLIAGTNILEIAVEGHDPTLVRDFTNAVGAQTVAYVQKLYETYELEPLDEAVLPRSPIKPDKALNLTLGGFFGLILGVGLALFAEYLRSGSAPYPVQREPEAAMRTPVQLMFKLQQELALLQAQFETTRRRFEQTQTALPGAGAADASAHALEGQTTAGYVQPGTAVPESSEWEAAFTELMQQLHITQARLAELQRLTRNYRAGPGAAGAPPNGRRAH